MFDYDTLIADKSTSGSIRNWINRSDVPAEQVLREAEIFLYEQLRLREMEAIATITAASGETSVALPERFVSPIEFRPYGWGHALPYVDAAWLNQTDDEDGDIFEGTPSRWAIIGEEMHFNIKLDEEFKGRLLFFQHPPYLSSSAKENVLTRRFPTLLRNTCLRFGYEHAKDTERAREYLQLIQPLIQQANATADEARRGQVYPGSGGPE